MVFAVVLTVAGAGAAISRKRRKARSFLITSSPSAHIYLRVLSPELAQRSARIVAGQSAKLGWRIGLPTRRFARQCVAPLFAERRLERRERGRLSRNVEASAPPNTWLASAPNRRFGSVRIPTIGRGCPASGSNRELH